MKIISHGQPSEKVNLFSRLGADEVVILLSLALSIYGITQYWIYQMYEKLIGFSVYVILLAFFFYVNRLTKIERPLSQKMKKIGFYAGLLICVYLLFNSISALFNNPIGYRSYSPVFLTLIVGWALFNFYKQGIRTS